jgi:bifunctional UDP-N-acetylglucosamine pyrophosphorylase/glucosamine-1-phosphate N-acetyltransferase
LVQSVDAPVELTCGVNDRVQLAEAERVARDRVRRRLMLGGVTLIDPASTYVDDAVEVGPDTTIYPGSIVEGTTRIGSGCRVGPRAHIVDSTIGDGVVVDAAVVERSVVMNGARIGPFCHLRPGARLLERADLGNYAEVKNATIGVESKMHHFSYIGDAEIGADVNIGAGTITCNYDSETGRKSRTIVERGVSLGSDTMLVAPVRIGENAITAAGSVVTRDVGDGMVVVGVPARPVRARRRPDPGHGG